MNAHSHYQFATTGPPLGQTAQLFGGRERARAECTFSAGCASCSCIGNGPIWGFTRVRTLLCGFLGAVGFVDGRDNCKLWQPALLSAVVGKLTNPAVIRRDFFWDFHCFWMFLAYHIYRFLKTIKSAKRMNEPISFEINLFQWRITTLYANW